MVIFKKISQENTSVTIKIALDKAKEMSTDVVLATSSGNSAIAIAEYAAETGYSGKIVAITQVWGTRKPGENEMSDETRKKLTDLGVILVTAAHTLSGVERSLSGKFGGVYPVEIMAYTLRLFSQGVKVCVEVASMALDAGAIKEPREVVVLGGTGRGLDTACIITPGYSAKIFETKIHEILCKPY